MNRRSNPALDSPTLDSSRKRTQGFVSSAVESAPSGNDLTGRTDAVGENPRKARKVSRACDYCKTRKAKCSGTQPCDKCTQKGRSCQYDAKYSRGRPPTPPHSSTTLSTTAAPVIESTSPDQTSTSEIPQPTSHHPGNLHPGPNAGSAPASRASPEHAMAEIQGQVFDTTSGVTFLHRASRRLARQRGPDSSSLPSGVRHTQGVPYDSRQPVMSAGDLPLPQFGTRGGIEFDLQLPAVIPPRREAQRLLAMYFDVCVVTYLILHQPLVEAWLAAMQDDVEKGLPGWQRVGTARAAIVFGVLAIAAAHEDRVASPFPEPLQTSGGRESCQRPQQQQQQNHHDRLFCAAQALVEAETGLPRLESAQARLIQTLYLLTTSRMNRAWYTFGNALQMISALGLHRKAARRAGGCGGDGLDYIQSQLQIRTFWTAYILDKYIGVIMGRPRHYHDDDIDQVYPDRVDDEDVDAQGPIEVDDDFPDCHLDALICHAKIARIIGAISREVYSIKPITEQARCDAARRLSQDLRRWKASLPPHLGAIRPSMLGGFYRRQSLVLRFAYCHGVMHANRLFLLSSSGGTESSNEAAVKECVAAAQSALEAVDGMVGAQSKSIQALWWTQYVAFHALVISYVWDIQRKRRPGAGEELEAVRHAKLMALAERCQTYLAEATAANSPSRRYAVILDELRLEALGQQQRSQGGRTERSGQGVVDSAGRNNNRTAARQHVGYCSGVQQERQVLETEPSSLAVTSGGVMQDVGMVGGLDNVLFSGGGGIANLFDGWQTTDWLDLDSTAFGFYIQHNSPEWMTNMSA
ncbi:uncharacterized protein PgNI_09156 [Pyricularia grisea]|uniref:Zn(2)-C6 fungal-type domain-containing protein n=1 Tax=Pyricularia grisea TaxID=148305 RepID=A0A6P8ASR7_PYRGI|nr:uncharacterized protein PgNI_09156 [Pyricularia grisea]TLD05171.1 hypothetical protein PgNI_09156 [Pyricularia grisea]